MGRVGEKKGADQVFEIPNSGTSLYSALYYCQLIMTKLFLKLRLDLI